MTLPDLIAREPGSILDQARADGYQKGYESGRHFRSNWNQCLLDEAQERGRRYAEGYAPRKMTWFLFGLLCGVTPYIWSFWL